VLEPKSAQTVLQNGCERWAQKRGIGIIELVVRSSNSEVRMRVRRRDLRSSKSGQLPMAAQQLCPHLPCLDAGQRGTAMLIDIAVELAQE
jgi:hypothetical protein